MPHLLHCRPFSAAVLERYLGDGYLSCIRRSCPVSRTALEIEPEQTLGCAPEDLVPVAAREPELVAHHRDRVFHPLFDHAGCTIMREGQGHTCNADIEKG